MRALVGLVVVIAACDQGAPPPTPAPSLKRPHTVARTTVHLDDALPAHGIVLHIYGIGGDDLVAVDTDASTVRSAQHGFDVPKPTERTRPLSAGDRGLLLSLADAAWREEPNGHAPDVTDIGSHLAIADGDDVFVASGTIFWAPWRPAAALLVTALDVAAAR